MNKTEQHARKTNIEELILRGEATPPGVETSTGLKLRAVQGQALRATIAAGVQEIVDAIRSLERR